MIQDNLFIRPTEFLLKLIAFFKKAIRYMLIDGIIQS